LKHDIERNRMQMQIDNEPTSPPKSINIDKWSFSSPENTLDKSINPRAEKGTDSLLHKTKKKPKILRTKAKKKTRTRYKTSIDY